jgi:predicted metalloprotease
MTFNPNADISGGAARSGGGARTGIALGGGGGLLLTIVIIVVSQVFGINLSDDTSGSSSSSDPGTPIANCDTGAQANADTVCRMKGASAAIDAYWSVEAPKLGITDYATPGFTLFSGSTSTGCGTADADTGPFYCPPDKTIYLDTGFFDQLRTEFGATAGPLAQLYVVAHEWGHSIQDDAGTFEKHPNNGDTGAGSVSVRTELQADCYAGAWVGAAATTTDENGVTFLEPVTKDQIADALNAAASIGDDRIQKDSGDAVNSETWTHGSSAERERWFTNGYQGGPKACDTFSVAVGSL